MSSSRKMRASKLSNAKQKSTPTRRSTHVAAAARRWAGALAVKLQTPAYRHAVVRANLYQGIAHQIRSNRERHGLTQSQLGRKLGASQTIVSRLEDPAYGRFTLATLTKVAEAFDTALLVKFVGFPKFLYETADKSPGGLYSPTFTESCTAIVSGAVTLTSTVAANVPFHAPGATTYISIAEGTPGTDYDYSLIGTQLPDYNAINSAVSRLMPLFVFSQTPLLTGPNHER